MSGLSLAVNSTTSTAANYRKVKSKCEINGTQHTHRFVLWTSRWLTIAFFKRQVFSGVLDTLASRGLGPWVIEYTILYVDISTTWIGFLGSSSKKPSRNDIIYIYILICIFPKKHMDQDGNSWSNRLPSWWLNQPIWKIWTSNRITSPSRGENGKKWNHHPGASSSILM